MDTTLIDLLRTVAHDFQAQMQDRIAREGSDLTPFQARLVNLIGRNEGISQLTLGSFTERDKAQIARTVKELEARDLITRRPHETDWRTKCLALTEQGRTVHARLLDVRARLAAEALGDLNDSEKHALRCGLEKMKAALHR